MKPRFVFIVVTIVLILINGIVLLFSKLMKTNLQISQKYEEIDLSSEIERMNFLDEISLVFLLILFIVFTSGLWAVKNK